MSVIFCIVNNDVRVDLGFFTKFIYIDQFIYTCHGLNGFIHISGKCIMWVWIVQEQGSLKFKSFNSDSIDICYLFECRKKRSPKWANGSKSLSSGLQLFTSFQWCEPDLSSKGMKGCCKQYTIVLFHQRQETGGLDVCLNSPPSYPCCHVFNSLFILMWQINRYGWTQWEGDFPLIELTRSDALVTTLHVFCNSISKTNASLGGGPCVAGFMSLQPVQLHRALGLEEPMLCYFHLGNCNLNNGPSIFILNWAPQIL